MESSKSEGLYVSHVRPFQTLINRTQILLNSIALLLLIHYRISFFFQTPQQARAIATLPWLLVFASELLLGFIWLLGRASRWRPEISNLMFAETKPSLVPAIDVFICTTDHEKEPTLDVMNTLISAMALDYPPEKLHVYLSDDGGSPVTLRGIREARRFARWWVPFCRKYAVTQPCPEAYFSAAGDIDRRRDVLTDEFLEQELVVKEKYEEFKNEIRSGTQRWVGETASSSRLHRPPFIQIIKSNDNDVAEDSSNQSQIPVVVYVSRERKPSHPHHFKAGALNVLDVYNAFNQNQGLCLILLVPCASPLPELRVSGVTSNSPYILVLDCDMYCNDSSSARRAMRFHLNPQFSKSLSFVQFPQRFYTASKNDIYDSQLRSLFTVEWSGMNGLEGPILSGTCYYINRLSLYGTSPQDNDPLKHREDFGTSKEFIKSLNGTNKREFPVEEAQLLASCTYETGSKWGQKIGFGYDSVVEDFLTSLVLHSRGWRSVFSNPDRAQFLGSGTTGLNETLVQATRWSSGLLEVGLSRFCPLFYGRPQLSLLQAMCYSELAFYPLCSFSIWGLATVPQLCLLHGIPVFPKVSSPFFFVYCFIFISSTFMHFHEVLISGGSLQKWLNERRIWMIKGITGRLYGSLHVFVEKFGLKNMNFVPTNKVIDDDQIKRYNMDIYDFQASTLFLAPLAGLVFLNLVAFTVGFGRVASQGDWEEIFGQVFLCIYILLMSFPIIEAMVMRTDRGCFPFKVTLGSALVVLVLLYLEFVLLI